MRCPNCNEEMEDGFLYCKKCGEEIRIVPDYNPLVEDMLSGSLQDIFMEKKQKGRETEGKPKEEKQKNSGSEGKQETERSVQIEKRRGKKLAAFVLAGLLTAGIVFWFFVMGIRSNSYEYQYRQAAAMNGKAHYEKAMKYADRAIELDGGKPELWKLKAQIALSLEDRETAKACYEHILESLDPNNQEIYIKLIDLYIEDGQLERAKKALASCQERAVLKYFEDYIAVVPAASFPEGIYYDTLHIALDAQGQDIYFTTDGSRPTTASTKYEGEIRLGEGKTTIRAISITEAGIVSDEAIFNYEISYLEPELPVVSPASGEYPGELEIVVQVPDGCTVLYTLDASLPTLDSSVYTEPIRISSSTVFTAVSVSMSDHMSDPIVRNYVITPIG